MKVLHIANDYSWGVIFQSFDSREAAVRWGAEPEGENDGYKVRWVADGETLPKVDIWY